MQDMGRGLEALMSIRNLNIPTNYGEDIEAIGTVAEISEIKIQLNPKTKEGHLTICWWVCASLPDALAGCDPLLTPRQYYEGNLATIGVDLNDLRNWAYNRILELPGYAGGTKYFD
jgi:hypothetical protein